MKSEEITTDQTIIPAATTPPPPMPPTPRLPRATPSTYTQGSQTGSLPVRTQTWPSAIGRASAWSMEDIKTAADKLSKLLRTAESHGTQPSEATHFDASQAGLPQTDFTALTEKVSYLNPYLTEFSRDLSRSIQDQSTFGPQKVIVHYAETLKALLEFEPTELRSAHQAITFTSNQVFLPPTQMHIEALKAVNEGAFFFGAAHQINQLLHELVDKGREIGEPTVSAEVTDDLTASSGGQSRTW